MQSMKIVLTVHQFLPDFVAGTEILTYHVAQELRLRGHDVVIWTGHASDSNCVQDQYEYDGIRVMRYWFNPVRVARSTNTIKAQFQNGEFEEIFTKYLADERPDLIHCFHLGNLSATTIHAALANRVPALFTATDFWLVCPMNRLLLPDGSFCSGPDRYGGNCLKHIVATYQRNLLKKIIMSMPDAVCSALCWAVRQEWWPERRHSPKVASLSERHEYLSDAMNNLDRVFVPTLLMKDVLVRHGLDPERVIYQPYGIVYQTGGDGQHFIRREGVLRLGFIGTLYEGKGVHVLLEAVRRLGRGAAVELKIYGSERQYPKYAARMRSLTGSDPRVQFCGTFPAGTTDRVLRDMDALVVPSVWYENSPLVLHSAQAAGVPVIATNSPGMTEVIRDEYNGLLFKKGDAEHLAMQIGRLIDDRDLLCRLSRSAIRPKTMAVYVSELEHHYGHIIAERRKHA